MSEERLAVPDVNVLVALTNPSHVFHQESHRWLRGVLRYATTPVTEAGLMRLLLNPAVTGQPVTARQALGILSGIRADPRSEFLVDDTSLADAVVDTTGIVGHQQLTDWHLLNLATRHDGLLITFDRKFARSVLPADANRIVTLGG